MTGLAGLFLVAFLAATPVPAQSEVVFLALQAAGWAVLPLVVVASVGNVLGSCVTYGLGRGAERFRDRRWFPLTPPALARAQGWWGRWGRWSTPPCRCQSPGGLHLDCRTTCQARCVFSWPCRVFGLGSAGAMYQAPYG